MLSEEYFDLFRQFRIKAMGDMLRDMLEDAAYDEFSFEERMTMLLDAEAMARRSRKITKLMKEAHFKEPKACVEDILYLSDRSLKKERVLRWAACDWVEANEVMVVISKTGCGKSYLVQALGNSACRKLIPTRYVRLADMFDELNQARLAKDSSIYTKMSRFKNVQFLIIDDFMTTPIKTQGAMDLFEIMEAREGRRATLVASQLEPEEWYLRIEGELIADSILNRIATRARYVDIEGPNMREYLAKKKALR